MNRGPFFTNTNCAAGITAARTNFAAWTNLVNSYANSTNPAYGIRWVVWAKPTVNSSWLGKTPTYDNSWPNGVSDDVFHYDIYHCAGGVCGGYNTAGSWIGNPSGIPVIEFYFPGGNFEIERGCGNLVGPLNAPPRIDQPPTGTITVACVASQQVATVTLSDPDAATTGYVTTGSGPWQSGTVSSPGPIQIPIPQSVTSPYTAQGVQLHVKDAGPGGSGAYVIVASANTSVPCASFSCGGLTTNPARIDPFMSFSLTVSVNNSVNQTPPGATMSLKITPPAGASYSFNGSQAAGGSGGTSSATFSNLGPASNTGVYSVNWTLTASGVNQSCSGTFQVVDLPYLSVYGGDVEAGIGPVFDSGSGSTTCAVSPGTNASIFSWNSRAPNYAGGGAQYAVQALAQVEDFASALNATDNQGAAPAGLSLANFWNPPDGSKLDPPNGLFGGYYTPDAAAIGGAPYCDFTSGVTVTNTGNLTVNPAGQIAPSTQPVYVTGGDVYIKGNVVYANSGSWALPSDIPSYRLIVTGGDIYIDSGVTQLDGLYVTEPDSVTGKGGTIYTCATGAGVKADPAQFATYYSTCKNPLVVNGAFVAKQVWFMRTGGTLGQAAKTDSPTGSHHGAEVFNYTPELWLPRGTAAPNDGYASITGLPPVF